MRVGHIAKWIAGKGFGFIKTDENSQEIFVHQSDIQDQVRPNIGDMVTFNLTTDTYTGKLRASNVIVQNISAPFDMLTMMHQMYNPQVLNAMLSLQAMGGGYGQGMQGMSKAPLSAPAAGGKGRKDIKRDQPQQGKVDEEKVLIEFKKLLDEENAAAKEAWEKYQENKNMEQFMAVAQQLLNKGKKKGSTPTTAPLAAATAPPAAPKGKKDETTLLIEMLNKKREGNEEAIKAHEQYEKDQNMDAFLEVARRICKE